MSEQMYHKVLSRLSEEVVNYVSLSKEYQGGLLALKWYEIVDEAIANAKEKYPDSEGIKCGKKCDHCCKISVCITHAEAKLIVDYCKDLGLPMYKFILQQQKGETASTWIDLPRKYKSCVFLSMHGTCGIYSVRPSACRQHFSVSEQELCNMVRYPSGKIKIWRPIEIEYLAAAATIAGDASFMADKLLEVMGDK
jgi:Fe-S-cluster containining protein